MGGIKNSDLAMPLMCEEPAEAAYRSKIYLTEGCRRLRTKDRCRFVLMAPAEAP